MKILKVLILFILIFCMCSFVFGINVNTQQDTQTSELAPTTTYGTETEILSRSRLSRNIISNFQFTLTNYSIIDDANFNFFIENNYIPTVGVDYTFYVCNNTFDETTLTWNNQNTTIDECYYVSSISSNSMGTGWKRINITEQVNNNNDKIFTVKVMAEPMSYNSVDNIAIGINTKETVNVPYIDYINGTEILSVEKIINYSSIINYLYNNTIVNYKLEENIFNYNDSTNNNLDISNGNKPDKVAGIDGYGQDFNSNNNDYIYHDKNSIFELDNFYTNLWIKPQNVNGVTKFMASVFDRDGSGNYYGWEFKSTINNKLRFAVGKGSKNIDYFDSTTVLKNDSWYNVGLCFINGDTTIFINGSIDGTLLQNDTQTILYSSNNYLSLGTTYQFGGFATAYTFDGVIDEVVYIDLDNYNMSCQNLSDFFYNNGLPNTSQSFPFAFENATTIPNNITTNITTNTSNTTITNTTGATIINIDTSEISKNMRIAILILIWFAIISFAFIIENEGVLMLGSIFGCLLSIDLTISEESIFFALIGLLSAYLIYLKFNKKE